MATSCSYRRYLGYRQSAASSVPDNRDVRRRPSRPPLLWFVTSGLIVCAGRIHGKTCQRLSSSNPEPGSILLYIRDAQLTLDWNLWTSCIISPSVLGRQDTCSSAGLPRHNWQTLPSRRAYTRVNLSAQIGAGGQLGRMLPASADLAQGSIDGTDGPRPTARVQSVHRAG